MQEEFDHKNTVEPELDASVEDFYKYFYFGVTKYLEFSHFFISTSFLRNIYINQNL